MIIPYTAKECSESYISYCVITNHQVSATLPEAEIDLIIRTHRVFISVFNTFRLSGKYILHENTMVGNSILTKYDKTPRESRKIFSKQRSPLSHHAMLPSTNTIQKTNCAFSLGRSMINR